MTTDVLLIGLSGLAFAALLIFTLTRPSPGQDDDRDSKRTIADRKG